MLMKNPDDSIGNRTRNLPALEQCRNKLRHRVSHVCCLEVENVTPIE
jgi:hypothetical protein